MPSAGRSAAPARPRRRSDALSASSTKAGDITGLFAIIAAAPILLPALGVELASLAFAVPVVVLAYATMRCAAATRRTRERRRVWLALTATAGLAAVASSVGLAAGLLGGSADTAFYFGLSASLILVVATLLLARQSLRGTRLDALVEVLIFAALVAALGVYFVALPGFHDGDAVLTAVFLVDLVALMLTAPAMVSDDPSRRGVGRLLALACGLVSLGDGLIALTAAGHVGDAPELTAVLWAAAGASLVRAADGEGHRIPVVTARGERWIYTRLLFPLVAVVAMPIAALVVWLVGSLDGWSLVYFGFFFTGVLLLVFGRQAYLLVDNRRAIARERTLRKEMTRRNDDLQALTGLATTMTQTLEEEPIMERGLGVLHLAARASSSALHVGSNGSRSLHAVAGAWHEEHAWATGADDRLVTVRGGRHIVCLPLEARGNPIGTVTCIRRDDDPVDAEELERMRLLANQLAIAVQNARDYRDKLEQAIRDPLTGVYNRRFFFEALEKEVQRSERYGSSVAVVIFDFDDFKTINDTYGHTTGDEALRKVTSIAESLIRPVDSFARLGGEEFGLLLPETSQLDALLVAERLRTAVARHRILPGRRVTLSGGISACPQDARTAEELGKRADAALYWAKRNGKNLCAIASEVTASAEEHGGDGALAPLYALVSTIDSEPLHTRDHSENVAAYAVAIGQHLGLEGEGIVKLRRAALFHDIGKIAVVRSILAKPGPLDEHEWMEMKRHPEVGASMLQHAGLHEEAEWVRQHHEQIDGTGYPEGLAGDEIALEARILLVADGFEAMTSNRPYRDGMEIESALAELDRCAGTQFDPIVVEALRGLVGRGELTVLALRG